MEIKLVEYKDAIGIKQMIVNSPSIVDPAKVLKDLLLHIDTKGCVATKIVDGDKIVGVWFSKEFDKYVSLSYFYIDESIRRKMIVYEFFAGNRMLTDTHKPLLIKTEDTTGFERYVEPFDESKGIYVFRGFRNGSSS